MRGSRGWIFNVYVTRQGKFYWLGCGEGTELEAVTTTYCVTSKQQCGEDGIQGSVCPLEGAALGGERMGFPAELG